LNIIIQNVFSILILCTYSQQLK